MNSLPPDGDALRDDDDAPLQVLLQRGAAVDDQRSISQCHAPYPSRIIAGIMISPWVVAGWCLAAYLIGGLPVGWLLVRRKRYGLDLRKFGTGNIGTSNVYRHAGIDIAVIVGPLQFVQGFAPVLASRLLGCRSSASMLDRRLRGGRQRLADLHALQRRARRRGGHRGGGGALGRRADRAPDVLRVGRDSRPDRDGRAGRRSSCCPAVAFVFGGREGWILGSGCLAILVLLLLRRLEGLPRDARVYGHFWRRVYQRLVFDERPGRPLMGPRTDQGADTMRH